MIDPEGKKLNFIIGMGRSGTTILARILNAHPSVHCLPEANFLMFFLNDFKHLQSVSEAQINIIFKEIEIFSLSHPLAGWQFDLEEARKRIINLSRGKELSFEELCKYIYSEFKVPGYDKSNSAILIDKNPPYTILVDKIGAQFPASRFIWIIRDYRANVLSWKQHSYLKTSDVAENAIRWKAFNKFAYKYYLANKDRVMLLRYEDLVGDSENSIKKIFSFLNLDLAMPVAEMNGPSFETLTVPEQHKEYFKKKYSDLNRPLNDQRVDSWKNGLSAGEIEICDAICASFANKFNYRAQLKIPGYRKIWLKLKYSKLVLKVQLQIKNDQLLFYKSYEKKMELLTERHSKLGFIKSGFSKTRA